MLFIRFFALLIVTASLLSSATTDLRIKELASIEGVRDNQLIGYGLVVGLNGTGDRKQTVFSAQSLTNMLQQLGVSVPPTAIRVNNTAAVMITATLPPFAQPGSRIDITASAIGDASSLQGGIVIMTVLKGIDGQPYAVAQGPIVVGGFTAGGSGTKSTQNHPTVGRVPAGAIVERLAPSVSPDREIKLQLRRADYTTAARIVGAVNKQFGKSTARAESAGLVLVSIPKDQSSSPIEFISQLEGLRLTPDRIGRIVVNERTGTIVMGKEVTISSIAIMHGNLSVEVETTFDVSQPAPLSQGTTTVVPKVGVGIKEDKAKDIVLKDGANVEDLVKALMAIGSTPRDVIAILQSLRSAGALDAELEII